jgi:hypothetical protein
LKTCVFYLLIVLVLASVITFPIYSTELITKDQRQLVLEIIDNTCADSWCEGDFNFEFLEFSCNRINTLCDLKFYFINTDNDREIKSQIQLCHFDNITKLEQILDNNQRLNDNFYELLDTCISDREGLLKFD